MADEYDLQETLGLSKPPIAIAFLDAPPQGLKQWDEGDVPSGCTFWREAMKGKSFYTVPADHYNCAVGSYTHQIALPAERAKELEETVGFMVSSKYLEMSEVPGIPTLGETPSYVAYEPAETASFTPDAVLVAAKPSTAMLLYEAALRAGAGNALANILGRPGCAVLPLAIKTGTSALSFGCKGNRVFTGLPDDEIYFCIPGKHWEALKMQLAEIRDANSAMEAFYTNRKSMFPIVN